MNIEQIAPVRVETDRVGRHRVITDTNQIARMLTEAWPEAGKGKPYVAAVKNTMAGLEGRKNAELVRKAFVRAAKAAGIYISG